jgi:hypothetical protein
MRMLNEIDLATARGTRVYGVALWMSRLGLLLMLGWLCLLFWLPFGAPPIVGLVLFPYWLVIAAVGVITQVLLSRSGLPFLPRFVYGRYQRWLMRAIFRDIVGSPRR